jgi:Protein of unknown function (DUF2560).
MAITEMTEEQAMNLEVFKLVQSDTAAGEKAITLNRPGFFGEF